MPTKAQDRFGDFVWRHPWWSGAMICVVAVMVAAVPVVGGTLSVIVLLGGVAGELVVWNLANSRRRSIQAPDSVARLSPPAHMTLRSNPGPPNAAGPRPVLTDQPGATTVSTSPESSAPQPRRPALADILAQLAVDPTRRELDEQIEVAGETFYVRQIKAVFRSAGAVIASNGSTLRDVECLLVPDPWNEYDQNAVAVFIGGNQVGHVPAELAEDYSAPLRVIAGRGLLVAGRARIWAKDDGGMVRARITLLVPHVDSLD